MKTIQTKYVGEVTIDPSQCITFPAGLPGFAEETTFVLLNIPGNSVFQVLQSVTSPKIAFIVTDPYYFYKKYVFELDDNLLETLHITAEKDVVVFTIVTVEDPFEKSTLNLKAPLIIHSENRTGKQYILHEEEYPTKAPIRSGFSGEVKGE